ncbi:MAG: hypothetical protein CO184_00090 [Candidatus Zambryskibacteria bacterium CG_4_9_14_3_um_filter_40_16]|uniref:Uncharacterized protein n=2 Tax=Candidatus Zambryskiibacteriota TaxID=1817925 RepID=A0A2H0K8U5_9BACT|nr:MAG: hypothetical protein COV95_02220 [Candidatus Zambryskibacteria bacterium CG11_big_fil_rev_8_21_14_0_20_40_24]PJA34479.1 MAG: hypothetical protein CO184_00090 [Candidatus Zambryskibacteria bacterium CG_4_9_14_3_um_filter_40_16]
MKAIIFLPQYFYWHYSNGIKDLLNNLINFLSLVFSFFSIPILLSTIFSPWQRMGERYAKGFDLSKTAQTFVVNTIMRFVGFFIRFFTIFIGLISFLFAFVLSVLVFVSWLLMPIVLIFILSLGITKL